MIFRRAFLRELHRLTHEWYWQQFDYHAAWAWKAFQRDAPWAVAFDTETTGVEWHDRPFCVTVAWEGESHYIELGDARRFDIASAILCRTPTLICHNAKFDIQKVVAAGLIPRNELDGRVEDTLALAHLLDEHRSKKLKDLARTELGLTTDEDEILKVVRRKLKLRKDDGYDPLPRWVVGPYAVKDAEFTWDLWKRLRPRLARYPELVELYEHEMELTLVLHDMEAAGMAVDLDYVKRMVAAKDKDIDAAEADITVMAGEEFNANSPKQIMAAFEQRNIDLRDTTEATLSTVEHPLARSIVSLRKDSKLRGTYLVPMLREQRDGVIHPNTRQFGTVTGRMASGAAAA